MDHNALFEKHKKLLFKFANRAYRSYRIDYDEIVSQCYEIFAQTLKLFDVNRNAEFITYLFDRLKSINKFCYTYRKRTGIPINEELYPHYDNFIEVLSIEKSKIVLSTEAIQVLDYILSRKWEKPDSNLKPSFHSVKNFFVENHNWNVAIVRKAWNQLLLWWANQESA